MTDYMNKSLKELVADITADGVVDADEVAGIRQRIYADGKIERDEAEFLFAINDAVSGQANHPSWQKLFVEALTSHLLEDEESPGEVDEKEATWLIQQVEGDRQIDETEKALLASIKANAKSLPENLKAKLKAWNV
jgi:uncharacterized membrane protein YebE (DUF533 family)